MKTFEGKPPIGCSRIQKKEVTFTHEEMILLPLGNFLILVYRGGILSSIYPEKMRLKNITIR